MMERPWNSEYRKARGPRATLSGGIPWTGCQYSCTYDATVDNIQPQMGSDDVFAASGDPCATGTDTHASVFSAPYGRNVNTETTATISPKTYACELNADMTKDFRFACARDGENRPVLAIADNPSPPISVRWKYQKH